MASDDLIQLYGKYLYRKSRSDQTITDRQRILRHADRELRFGLDAAREHEVEDWLWRNGLAPNTRSTYYSALVDFYRWAAHVGVLTLDPTVGIERPKAPRGNPRVAADDHVRFIVSDSPEPYRLWGKLAAYGSLRCIEIFRLHREHMTPDRIHILRGKGNKPRMVPMHPAIWEAIKDLPEGPIAPTVTGQKHLSNSFLVYCRRRGMTRMSLHRMRGWFATSGYRATRDIRAVQASMGHSDPGVTAGYIEVADDQIKAVVDGLPLFG